MENARDLRPREFDADPGDPQSHNKWLHWYQTLTNYLAASKVDDGSKLPFLCNFVSHSIYELISDCESFNEAIATLKNLFEKPVNETYARHLLSTRRQLADESIDQYMQALKALAKPCNFKAVNAVDHQSEATRDAFIAGRQYQPVASSQRPSSR